MNLQSQLIVSAVLVLLVYRLLRSFFRKKMSSGQTLFWLCLLAGAEALTLFRSLSDGIGLLWGDLLPCSWITFCGLSALIAYLFHLTTQINRQQTEIAQLARGLAEVEKTLRERAPERPDADRGREG